MNSLCKIISVSIDEICERLDRGTKVKGSRKILVGRRRAYRYLKKDINDPRSQWVFIPIKVERAENGGDCKYWIIDGRHRLHIHRELGLKTIRAVIR